MKEQFTTLEIAKKLNELGFKDKCLGAYFVFGDNTAKKGNYGQTEPELFIFGIDSIDDRANELEMFAYHVVSVPLWQQVIDWFISKNLFITFEMCGTDDHSYEYYFTVSETTNPYINIENSTTIEPDRPYAKTYKTLYDARLEAILYAFKIYDVLSKMNRHE